MVAQKNTVSIKRM